MRVLIVEDDELYAVQLRMLIEECFGAETEVQHCSSIASTEKWLGLNQPDVILVDVILEDKESGVTLAHSIRKMGIPIIFITAFQREDLFRNALSVYPANYLQKPFTAVELKQAIELAVARDAYLGGLVSNTVNMGSILLPSSQHMLERVHVNTIIALESFGNYCHVYRVGASRITLRMPLKNYPDILPVEHFIRIHRRFVINLQLVDRINVKDQTVWLADLAFPLGEKYKKILFDRFSN